MLGYFGPGNTAVAQSPPLLSAVSEQLPQRPVLAGVTEAEHEHERIQPLRRHAARLVEQALVGMDGLYLPRKSSWSPRSWTESSRHSMFTGHSAIRGGLTVVAGSGVSPAAANLSVSRPLLEPQISVSLTMAEVGRLMTNSSVSAMSA